jgi:hypothetical protein
VWRVAALIGSYHGRVNTQLDGLPARDDTAAWPVTGRPVPSGPRAYRARIRAVGPLAALAPPAALGILGWLMLHDNESISRGVAGFAASVFAAPLLPVAGAPLRASGVAYVAAALASAIVWLLIGVVASRRATRTPVATWSNFWKEWAWLACAVWAGVVIALVASNLVLGRALL